MTFSILLYLNTGSDDLLLQVTIGVDADGSLVEEAKYINAAEINKKNADFRKEGMNTLLSISSFPMSNYTLL